MFVAMCVMNLAILLLFTTVITSDPVDLSGAKQKADLEGGKIKTISADGELVGDKTEHQQA